MDFRQRFAGIPCLKVSQPFKGCGLPALPVRLTYGKIFST
jgi:hypothetical protein